MKDSKEILIIDDDRTNIFALSAVLKAKKFKTIAAASSAAGFEILTQSHNIGVILLDMMMPEMDGYETVQQLKNHSSWAHLPVIAVTAQAMAGDREKCLEAGADGYISKPIDVDELMKLFNRFEIMP